MKSWRQDKEIREIYTTKKLFGNYSKPEHPVKEKGGNPITSADGQLNGWVLKSRQESANPPDIPFA